MSQFQQDLDSQKPMERALARHYGGALTVGKCAWDFTMPDGRRVEVKTTKTPFQGDVFIELCRVPTGEPLPTTAKDAVTRDDLYTLTGLPLCVREDVDVWLHGVRWTNQHGSGFAYIGARPRDYMRAAMRYMQGRQVVEIGRDKSPYSTTMGCWVPHDLLKRHACMAVLVRDLTIPIGQAA